jgi:beta-lactamase superfamily II metal-dependent hydrolase
MIFSLDLQRARKGDCLLVHYGSKDDPGLMLIDGGPAQVYEPFLKPRLKQLHKARGLDNEESLNVDQLMVSHIDDDHVNGILELMSELVDAKDSQKPLLLRIRSIWHNTFDDIIGNKPEELLSAVTASFGTAALSGVPDIEGLSPDTAMVLASVRQGYRLRDDARKLNIRINKEFNNKLIMATSIHKRIAVNKGLNLSVVGPMQQDLVALQKEHDKFLEKQIKDRKTKTALASFTDTSIANLSSIVILAEVEGKSMLLTGDARGDKIMQGLEMAGLMKKNGSIHVDILKIPHHGSDRNIDPSFFRRITADHYVFSGNGEHGNPERETLKMLLDENGNENYTIHLTYPISEIDAERKKKWHKELQREKQRKKKKPEMMVREDWSPKKHSLTDFFNDNKDFAKKVSIVNESDPHVINLLDKLVS